MSASKPQTLLAFIYNATVTPSYRTEMHTRMESGFERFDVADKAAREACFAVERAAYELRVSSEDVQGTKPKARFVERHTKAVAAMNLSTVALFNAQKRELKQLLITQPQVPPLYKEVAPLDGTPRQAGGIGPVVIRDGKAQVLSDRFFPLLAYVYYFAHYPDLRPAILSALAQASDPLLQEGHEALEQIHNRKSTEDLAEAVDRLCDVLQREYAIVDWVICW